MPCRADTCPATLPPLAQSQAKFPDAPPALTALIMAYFNTASFWLSRVAFVLSHVAVVYWVLFITNDPLQFGVNTMDAPAAAIKPAGQCRTFIKENAIHDLLLFAVWWGSHSLMARKKFKVALGLWEHPIERPLFAFVAAHALLLNVHHWRPISDCARFDVFQTPGYVWAISGTIYVLALVLALGLFYTLPDHVFGTSKYKYPQGKEPKGKLIYGFPYSLVRHPAATAFLWMYWALPAYTASHLFLAALWTVFILVGTLAFEEGGLRGADEFSEAYDAYSKQVPALYPSLASLRLTFGGARQKDV